jgi:hypothetical protein
MMKATRSREEEARVESGVCGKGVRASREVRLRLGRKEMKFGV